MHTELPHRKRGGFTLVEVMVALVILAVGLLALEAMGIGAARLVARAKKQSEYTVLATTRMERTLSEIRAGTVPANNTVTVPGASLATQVEQVPAGGRVLYTVSVVVTPTAYGSAASRPDTFRVVGSVYR